jgi:hypothetical protein
VAQRRDCWNIGITDLFGRSITAAISSGLTRAHKPQGTESGLPQFRRKLLHIEGYTTCGPMLPTLSPPDVEIGLSACSQLK